MPATINQFDPDDTTDPFLIINSPNNEPGVVIVPKVEQPPNFGAATKASSKDWLNSENYSAWKPFTPTTYLSYVRSRKKYHSITNLNSLESENIYLYNNGDLTLDHLKENNLTAKAPLLLIVTGGNVTIDDTIDFTFGDSASPASVAIVTDGSLNIGPNMKELNGLFVANQVDFGSSATELKIVGNIISTKEADPTSRNRADNSKPSVFIVFKPNMYLNLLPYFSTAAYEWRLLR